MKQELFRVKPSCTIRELIGEIVPLADGTNCRYDFSKASAGARQFISQYKWSISRIWIDPSDIEKYEGVEEDES